MALDDEILQRLQKNDASLRRLDLREQKLTEADIEQLVQALEKNVSVTEIDLSGNSLNDKSITCLIDILQLKRNLTTLLLNDAEITDTGANTLAKLLANDGLVHLELQNNQLTEKGIHALSGKLENGSISLTNLNLNGNPLTALEKANLANRIERNQTEFKKFLTAIQKGNKTDIDYFLQTGVSLNQMAGNFCPRLNADTLLSC